MQPQHHREYSVKALCPDCGAVAIWEINDQGRDIGYLLRDELHVVDGARFTRTHWRMLRCGGCGRAGLAKFYDSGNTASARLIDFHPRALARASIPDDVPEGVLNEYREAEMCATAGAWRGASALLRSALEKVLVANGYRDGSLMQKIDLAASDGVITAARKQRAHQDVRVLGNEIVHDNWRAVDAEEVAQALHYVQRILEDLLRRPGRGREAPRRREAAATASNA